jgi:hypothetical protein
MPINTVIDPALKICIAPSHTFRKKSEENMAHYVPFLSGRISNYTVTVARGVSVSVSSISGSRPAISTNSVECRL